MPRYSQRFQSTALSSGDYDTDTNTLDLTFTSGRSYTYENVPEHVWEGLVSARSAGQYFYQNIKDRY
jgi:KTSC domain